MTTETEVPSQLSEVSKVSIEEKCESDMSSFEDLSKVGGDCNGVAEHVDDDKVEEEQVQNFNVNESGKDDPDGSYVFVTRSDSPDRDLNAEGFESPMIPEIRADFPTKDMEGLLVGELNGETVSPKDNCSDEGTDFAPSTTAFGPIGERTVVLALDQNAIAAVESDQELLNAEGKIEEPIEPDTTPVHAQGKIEEQIEPDTTPDPEENQNSEVHLLDDVKAESARQAANFESTKELGEVLEEQTDLEPTAELREVQESEVEVLEARDHDGEEKSKEEINLVLTEHIEEGEKAQVLVMEAGGCVCSLLDDIKVNSKEDVDRMSTAELEGNQEPQVIFSETTECKSPDIVVGKVVSEKQTELDSQIAMPESSESESCHLDNGEKLEEEEATVLGMDIKPQPVVTDNIITTVDLGNEGSKFSETDVPLLTESANEDVLDESRDIFPTSQVEDSITLDNIANESTDDSKNTLLNGRPTSQVEDSISLTKILTEPEDDSQNTAELNGSSGNAENLLIPADCIRYEIQFGSKPARELLVSPVKDAKLDIAVENGTLAVNEISSCNELKSETDIELCSIDLEGKETNLACLDVITESEVSNGVTDCLHSQPVSTKILDPECHANHFHQNESSADSKSESEVENSASISESDMPHNDVAVTRSEVLDGSLVNFGSVPKCVLGALDAEDTRNQVNGRDGVKHDSRMCQETKDTEPVHRDEISPSAPEGSSANAFDEQNVGVETMTRPFNFLIRIPRFDDETLGDEIKRVQMVVDEKTKQRDAIRDQIQMMRDNCQKLHDIYEAFRSDERAARGLVRLKRQEIDAVQSVINRVKNAIAVQDIDVRINNMEHMINHETHPLKEEKQFIREIKQLKLHREQLSSNMGSQEEVQQALDQKDQIDKQQKILKRELDSLKDKVSKADEAVRAAEKKLTDESKKVKELYAEFTAADVVRQEAYVNLKSLKRLLYEKNTRFRMYKDDTRTANDFAFRGNKEELHHLCVHQVEALMKMWNNNDDFRKEYVRSNTKSTLRRFRTLDARALGPDEDLPALPNVVNERVAKSLSTPGKTRSEVLVPILEQEKQVAAMEGEEMVDKSVEKLSERMDQTAKTNKDEKSSLRKGSATVSGVGKTEEPSEKEHMEEENKQRKEEQELARKEEERRKEEEAAKLREQRRLEEIAKAKEALERKKKHAEKAQIRAELRAQKEAEQKEKEREKRAKKKERKKAAEAEIPDGNNEGETVPTSEIPVVTTKEPEVKENSMTTSKRPQKPSQFGKSSKTKSSIPPPLRNRGKRRMQQWIWVIAMVLLAVVSLVLLGNIGIHSRLMMRSPDF